MSLDFLFYLPKFLQGCASWDWYFPYHYAPFASDFINVAEVPQKFSKDTKPFKPLEQLMGVFPAASRSHVPEPWGQLMIDPDSPIIDFYPEDFKIDLNGKKFAWQVRNEVSKKIISSNVTILTNSNLAYILGSGITSFCG